MVTDDTGALPDFVTAAFDGEELARVPVEDGTLGHGEIRVGDTVVPAFDRRPDWPVMPSLLRVYVPDAGSVRQHLVGDEPGRGRHAGRGLGPHVRAEVRRGDGRGPGDAECRAGPTGFTGGKCPAAPDPLKPSGVEAIEGVTESGSGVPCFTSPSCLSRL